MPWYLLALLSAASTSTASFVEKRALSTMRSIAFSLRVSYLVALVSIPALWFVDFSNFGARELVITVGVAALGSIGYVRVTHGIRRLDVGEATPLLLLSPALTAILAFLILDESISRGDVLGMIIIFAGAYLLEAGSDGLRGILKRLSQESGLRYVAQGVGLYAITAVVDRIMLSVVAVDPIAYLSVAQIAVAVWMTLFSLVLHKRHHVQAALAFPRECHAADDVASCQMLQKTSRAEWFATLYIALATLANRFFFVQAAAIAPIGPVTALRRSSALFNALFDGEHKASRTKRIGACIIMLGGVVLLAVS